MIDWDCLLDEDLFASVLPGEYARFCRPVRGALVAFLQGLPEARQAAVLEAQAALPPTASAAQRLAVLARSCPALHKLGQVLARDRRLGPELRRQLQALESLPPSVPLPVLRDILDRELGSLDRLGITLAREALAEASVAVVVPFRYDRPPRGAGPGEGVFKVLKPGIEERLEQELGLFERVGSYLEGVCDEYGLPQIDYREVFEQVREKLRGEVRLDLEQQHLARARDFYAGEDRVQVPAMFAHSTPRVTAMERLTGWKVTEHHLDIASDKRRLADLVVEALIARPIFADADPAPFHADPHAGNLLFTADRRLGILDWSLVGRLGEPERRAIAQITLAALMLDAERLAAALAELAGGRQVDEAALGSVVRAGLRRVRQGQFPGFTWLMGLLDEAVQAARLRVSADLLLFRKSLYTLEGVLADVGASEGRIDSVLQGEFFRRLVDEWPRRWLARPDSRAFATRLSNADLARFVLGLPWTWARFWLDQGLDLLNPWQPLARPRLTA